jgi:hypothetical protein
MAGRQTVDETITEQTFDATPAETTQEAEQNRQDHPLQLALAIAERKLAEARLQIAELEALLEDIPEIFERKFEQRLQPVLERQERLLEDNADLRQQIQLLAPVPGEVRLRFNPGATSTTSRLALPQLPSRAPIRRLSRAERQGPSAA